MMALMSCRHRGCRQPPSSAPWLQHQPEAPQQLGRDMGAFEGAGNTGMVVGQGHRRGTLSTVPSALRSSTLSLAGSGLPVATQLTTGSEPRLNSSSEASRMIWGNRSGTQKLVLGLALLFPRHKRGWHLSPVLAAARPCCQGAGARCCSPALIPTPHAGLSNALSTANPGGPD